MTGYDKNIQSLREYGTELGLTEDEVDETFNHPDFCPCDDCEDDAKAIVWDAAKAKNARHDDGPWEDFQASLPPGVDSVEEFERLGLDKRDARPRSSGGHEVWTDMSDKGKGY